jgi:hypothetical protein
MTSTREDRELRDVPASSTRRHVAAGGLLVTVVGIGLQKWAGVDMPPVPPSAVLLVVAAVALVAARGRWPRVLALVVLVAEALGFVGSGSLADLGGGDGFDVTAASSVRLAGIVVAALALVPLLRRRPLGRRE